MRAMGKNPNNYETVRKEACVYKQKPINIDDFNESEEKEVKERVNKRKKKRCQIAENKLLKKTKKSEESKVKEKDMWERLAKLNGEFKEIKKTKKEAKKMSETVIN